MICDILLNCTPFIVESTAYILLLCDVCTVYIQLEIGDVIYAAFVLLLPLAGVFFKLNLFSEFFKKLINVKIIKMKVLLSEKGKTNRI